MKSKKRLIVKYSILIFTLFGFLISSRAFGNIQGMGGLGGEFKGDLKFLAGPGNTLNLFYRYSFQSLDYGFDDWAVISSIDFNFTTPKRVGGGLGFGNYHEDTAQLPVILLF